MKKRFSVLFICFLAFVGTFMAVTASAQEAKEKDLVRHADPIALKAAARLPEQFRIAPAVIKVIPVKEMAKQEQYKAAMKAVEDLPAFHLPGRKYFYINADLPPYRNVEQRWENGSELCPELFELAAVVAHEDYHVSGGHIGWNPKTQALLDQLKALDQEIAALRHELKVFTWFVENDGEAKAVFDSFRYNPQDHIRRIEGSLKQVSKERGNVSAQMKLASK